MQLGVLCSFRPTYALLLNFVVSKCTYDEDDDDVIGAEVG